MNHKLFKYLIIFSILFSSSILLNNCSFDDAEIERAPFPEDIVMKRERERRERLGDSEDDNFVLDLFDNVIGNDNKNTGGGGPGISVNAFLWRASLDTLSFMPLLSADPFGGVIITDWHSISETSEEKYKVVAYILDKELRVDALKVSVFKKRKSQEGNWIDAQTSNILKNKVEDAILTKARKYKLQSID